jgi:hypothetical protein
VKLVGARVRTVNRGSRHWKGPHEYLSPWHVCSQQSPLQANAKAPSARYLPRRPRWFHKGVPVPQAGLDVVVLVAEPVIADVG